ncbi:MAG: hypothetical protein JXB07_08420 [Anaerolineae bacterium]|nr:hypothetical protein [Anaerolineae bacterium]
MTQPILHDNLPLIEVADRLLLDDLYADPQASLYLLARLSDTVAVVAPGQVDVLQARLLKLGHTPKMLE